MRPPTEKQLACDRITGLLGMEPLDIDGRQRGTVLKPVFERAAFRVGIPYETKERTTEAIIRRAGLEWKAHYDSRQSDSKGQGNITIPGLWALGDALGILLADGDEPGAVEGSGGTWIPDEGGDRGEGTWVRDGGQRRMLDPERRKKIELAAQDWLMEHFENEGWDVEDTHIGHPYDAIARRRREVLYLEAKGTTTNGDSVIVTRNEVRWALKHPDQSMLGVWAGMEFDEHGEVIQDSGYQLIQPFNPYDEDLDPIAFDYRVDWP